MNSILDLHIKNGRFHHGYFLVGEAEQAKSKAEEMTKVILGSKTLLGHLDCAVFDYSVFGIEESHYLAHRIFQRPIVGENKVFIVLADSLTREAGNALLKIFEEPPSGTYVFFSLPRLVNVPKTLRSRFIVVAMAENNQVENKNSPGFKFLLATLPDRLKQIKVTSKDRLASQTLIFSIADSFFFSRISKNISDRQVFSSLQDALDYAGDRGSMPTMLLEHLALVLPRHVE